MISLNRISKKLLLLQRNELLSKKQVWLRKKFGRLIFTNFFVNYFQDKKIEKKTDDLFLREIKTFEKYLPNSASIIMDIGCGLGIINIYLNKYYSNKPEFILLDKNKIDKKIKYGFSSKYESYNYLDVTKEILVKNNIKEDQLTLFDVDKKIEINKKIDLVISLKSMGYHYPIEIYLDLIKKSCNEKTFFIFDVSENYYHQNLISKYFEDIQVIYEEKSIHPLKRLFCSKLKL